MSGVVFDTSVWIEYFKANPTYFKICKYQLEKTSVFTLEVIFAELMQGAKGKREIQLINGHFESLTKLDRAGLVYEAGIHSQNEKLIQKGIGLIDSIIIYAVLSNGLKLWTLDKRIIEHLNKKYVFKPN